MNYPKTLHTSLGTFSLKEITDNNELVYTGNELITNDLIINGTEYDGIIITVFPEIFRESKEDDMIHYFEFDGKEVNYNL